MRLRPIPNSRPRRIFHLKTNEDRSRKIDRSLKRKSKSNRARLYRLKLSSYRQEQLFDSASTIGFRRIAT
jgi:hypothetical protein